MQMVALNAYENDGSKRLWIWWLWMPMKIMALNVYENDEEKFDNFYTGDMP